VRASQLHSTFIAQSFSLTPCLSVRYNIHDMSSQPLPIIQMVNITKTFPGGVIANQDVSLSVIEGTIHAIIGENGAGKSTLMNILYGRFQPDSGRIRMRGEDVRIESPAKAISLGLGMVTQHTTMIPALSVLDNIILGAEPAKAGVLNRKEAINRVSELCTKLGVQVDANASAGTLSVAALQKAEIVKALFRGAKILILDEPTATLAPLEADSLFSLLHTLAEAGTTVVFITHKLREVMAHSANVTVLRGGRTVSEIATADTNPDELLAWMLGRRTAAPGVGMTVDNEASGAAVMPWQNGPLTGDTLENPATWMPGSPGSPSTIAPKVPVLEIRNLQVLNDRKAPAVRDFSLSVAPGEILGIAGVDGSGQKELAEAIVGLRQLAQGSILLDGVDISRESVGQRLAHGVGYVPEDRHREGLVLDFSLAENLILGRQRDKRFGGGAILDLRRIAENGDLVVQNHRVRAPNGSVPARTLSGGNQQKIVIARALEGNPRLLVAMQPTRGLDVEATRFVYSLFRDAVAKGLAILLFSLDLDEIMEIADRVAVMYDGHLNGILPRADATPDRIGNLMVGGQL
jgi:ABC-type uncharacterized transport system ATPase subunit